MTGPIPTVVRDPTLSLLVVLSGWTARETRSASVERLRSLNRTLRQLGWMPEGTAFPPRDTMKAQQLVLWQPTPEPVRLEDGPTWDIQRFGQAIHEEVAVMLGVGLDGQCPVAEREPWIASARPTLESTFLRPGWEEQVVLPGAPGETNLGRPEILGRAWIWTGEWSEPPDDGWDGFGRTSYLEGAWISQPWGIVGYHRGGESELPRFDLHTTIANRVARDRFLYDELNQILVMFLKAEQSNRRQFEDRLGPSLDDLDLRIRDHYDPVRLLGRSRSLEETDQTVRELTTDLYRFGRGLAELEGLAINVEIARDVIAGEFSLATAPRLPLPALTGSVGLLAAQMRRDLSAYQATANLGQRALESIRTLVEIEDTRNEQRIAMIGIIAGVCLGIGQLLDPAWPWWSRLTVSLVPGIIASGIYAFVFNHGPRRFLRGPRR